MLFNRAPPRASRTERTGRRDESPTGKPPFTVYAEIANRGDGNPEPRWRSLGTAIERKNGVCELELRRWRSNLTRLQIAPTDRELAVAEKE